MSKPAIKNFNPRITIIGSGIVGQATGKGFLSKDFPVTFIDVDEQKIKKLREDGYDAIFLGEFDETTHQSDISFISVPTPTVDGIIKLEYLKQACVELGKRLRKTSNYHLIVTRSTLIPGTNRNLVIKTVEKYSGKKAGVDFGLCTNPEYLREKSAQKDFLNPWIILIGEYDKRSGDLLSELFKKFNCPIHRATLEEAEMQKYIHNLFNAVKISFFNEFREICDDMELGSQRIFELVTKSCEGMWNSAYGTYDLGPFDGKCLPKDMQAFFSWAKQKGYEARILGAAIASNEELKERLDIKD